MNRAPSAKILLGHLDWNIKRLEEILKQEKSDYFRDAALQRFGFTFDMALKSLAAMAEAKGQPCFTADECFERAANLGWLEKTDDWRDLVNSCEEMKKILKGQTPAERTGALADAIYAKLNNHRAVFQKLYHNLSTAP
ncbi:MAG: nucleotidyltransferase substrate binding protein [Nitrospinae bacterium]|nr:nucleotidyltransferase substrate binding protein [Nitrospinota bacterium]